MRPRSHETEGGFGTSSREERDARRGGAAGRVLSGEGGCGDDASLACRCAEHAAGSGEGGSEGEAIGEEEGCVEDAFGGADCRKGWYSFGGENGSETTAGGGDAEGYASHAGGGVAVAFGRHSHHDQREY